MSMHKLNNEFVFPPNVMTRMVGEELVLLDLVGGSYYGLNPIGTRIWELIQAGHTTDQVRVQMLEEFDVSPEQLSQDMSTLLKELLDRKLLLLATP
jgi:Coenzyme PQQ synthesis protein D (PqqD)